MKGFHNTARWRSPISIPERHHVVTAPSNKYCPRSATTWCILYSIYWPQKRKNKNHNNKEQILTLSVNMAIHTYRRYPWAGWIKLSQQSRPNSASSISFSALQPSQCHSTLFRRACIPSMEPLVQILSFSSSLYSR
jgi:hypothetical protein